MRTMVWNAQGLGSGRTFRTLLNLKQHYNSKNLFLMETKATHLMMEKLRVRLGFKGFYGHPEVQMRHLSWTLLKRLQGLSDLPWLYIGDFNEILYNFENEGGVEKPQSQLEGFREALDHCGLEDLGFSHPPFT
ncbi:hypothetical protein Dsin_002200 [Dipteronia sinensis]|uniref:Exo_endo_phos domain-containing protein n=1 Tax=Dipteronia sinensis TaxID=43782 RepID=A0AAE0EJG4_9ROSI|nr:hypothetical protein Dsin_002200 [Dipteronia sinensis]